MLRSLIGRPTRILMTVDAVGGVWRYALDLAGALSAQGCALFLAGLGPEPSAAQRREAERIGRLTWLDEKLDWMAGRQDELGGLPARLATLVQNHGIDLVHLNAPAQACGLSVRCPVVVVSHSCVATWFHTVRGGDVPPDWRWQMEINRQGFDSADAVLAPSRSHADMLEACYGPVRRLSVVHNASGGQAPRAPKENFVFAAARWWDEGKNARLLDEAASLTDGIVLLAGPETGPNGQSVRLRHAIGLGALPGEDVRTIMAYAGAFVSPSLYEPFGLAVLEAARSGAALLLAAIPTYRELWDRAAVFVPPRDAKALAAAISRLSKDAPLRAELGALAMEQSRAYTAARQANEMLAVYSAAATAALARA